MHFQNSLAYEFFPIIISFLSSYTDYIFQKIIFLLGKKDGEHMVVSAVILKISP